MTFIDLVHEDDVEHMLACWSKLAVDAEPVSFEFRWKWNRDDLTDEEKEVGGHWVKSRFTVLKIWANAVQVIASCLPLLEGSKDETTSLTGAMAVMITNTQAKLSALNFKKRAEALELAKETEQRFKAFADQAPAGIYIFDNQKALQYCNPKYLSLLGAPVADNRDVDFWHDCILEEDIASVSAAFDILLTEHTPISHEFRVNQMWVSPDGVESNAYCGAYSYPVLDDAGNLISIQGIMFDISNFKWAETYQKIKVEEAIEAKKQQERFIDMTSHELR